jgi:hypothetical protein
MGDRKTLEERITIVKLFSICDGSVAEVQRRFKKLFPGRSISKPSVRDICNKFDSTGTIKDVPRSGRPKTGRSEANIHAIHAKILSSPKKSTRRLESETDLSRATIHRILKNDLKLKCYIPTLVQELHDNDLKCRVDFAEKWLEMATCDPDFPNRIIWSDESIFKLNGIVNRHNCSYWSKENPRFVISKSLNSPGLMVWMGIMSDQIMGPIFFDEGTITGERYLLMLKEKVWPMIENRRDIQKLFFQQDGAPPHYSLRVREFLNEKFPERWIGRRGPLEWPPRSPDLTPLDFWLWGHLKEQVYAQKPKTLADLRHGIEVASSQITIDMCAFTCGNVTRRMERVIDANGAHVGRF